MDYEDISPQVNYAKRFVKRQKILVRLSNWDEYTLSGDITAYNGCTASVINILPSY